MIWFEKMQPTAPLKTVFLWGVDTDQLYLQQPTTLESLLSDDELDRANRFRFSIDRQRFIAGRAFLKTVLSMHCQTPPDLLQFKLESGGKPSLAASLGSTGQFSFSRSKHYAICGFSDRDSIGVDLELTDPGLEIELMATTIFSKVELRTWNQLPDSEQFDCFQRAWTRKEAKGKMSGIGISAGPDTIGVPLDKLAEGEARRLVGEDSSTSILSDWIPVLPSVATIVISQDQLPDQRIEYLDETWHPGQRVRLACGSEVEIPRHFQLTTRTFFVDE